jgi:hypothetical protein
MSRRPTPIKVASSPTKAVSGIVSSSASETAHYDDSQSVPHTPPKRNLNESTAESPVRSAEVSPSKRSKYSPLPVELVQLKDKNGRVFGFMVLNGFP